MISFTGVWHLFRFFYEQYPHLHKQIAMAVLILPNFVFWSAGVLKDPICTGALGWMTYALYELLIKKRNLLIKWLNTVYCRIFFSHTKIIYPYFLCTGVFFVYYFKECFVGK